jgi:hypothetical protein
MLSTEPVTAGDVEIGDTLVIDGRPWEVLHRSSRPLPPADEDDYPMVLYFEGFEVPGSAWQTCHLLVYPGSVM